MTCCDEIKIQLIDEETPINVNLIDEEGTISVNLTDISEPFPLETLTNVEINNLKDTDVLSYNEAENKWVNSDFGELQKIDWEDIQGNQNVVNISGFTNDIGYLTEEDLPDGSKWESDGAGYIKPKGVDKVKVSHIDGVPTNSDFNLSDLKDVDPTNKAIDKILQVRADGKHEYVNVPASLPVELNNLQDKDFLVYDEDDEVFKNQNELEFGLLGFEKRDSPTQPDENNQFMYLTEVSGELRLVIKNELNEEVIISSLK